MAVEDEMTNRDYILKYLDQQIRDYHPQGNSLAQIRYHSYVHTVNLYLRDFIRDKTGEDDDMVEVLERKRKEFYDCYASGGTGNEKNWFLGIYEDTVCYAIDVLLARKYEWS